MSTTYYAVCRRCRVHAAILTRFAGCTRFHSAGTRNTTDDAAAFIVEHAACADSKDEGVVIRCDDDLPDASQSTEVETTDAARDDDR